MKKDNPHKKLIFGSKIKHYRLENNLSFKEMAAKTGMSVSYLNEIEKGKKYPRAEKIAILAHILEVSVEELKSTELTGKLAPLGDLLHSNFLKDLPLELFGIDMSKIVDIIASSPLRVGAFVSTLVEMSRNYAVEKEHFYLQALRAYQEMNFSYLEDIEDAADEFLKKYNIQGGKPVDTYVLKSILEEDYGIKINYNGIDSNSQLGFIRTITHLDKKELLLNSRLNEMQIRFHLAKEIGFQFLNCEERPLTSSLIKIKSFEQVLNNFRAGYFAVAILVQRNAFIEDCKAIFKNKTWHPNIILDLVNKYKVSSSTVFQRFNVLPKYFGLSKLFFIGFNFDIESESIKIDKELHLFRQHKPHANRLNEHYCRRWPSIKALKNMKDDQQSTVVHVQKSKYHGDGHQYLEFSITRPSFMYKNKLTSTTMGILIDENAKNTIGFINDPDIKECCVNVTCQRCEMKDCNERAYPPVIIEKRNKRKTITQALDILLEQ